MTLKRQSYRLSGPNFKHSPARRAGETDNKLSETDLQPAKFSTAVLNQEPSRCKELQQKECSPSLAFVLGVD